MTASKAPAKKSHEKPRKGRHEKINLREALETLDLSTLTPAERKRVEKTLNRRDHSLSLKMRKRDVDVWKGAAETNRESLTRWIERNLNIAAEAESKK